MDAAFQSSFDAGSREPPGALPASQPPYDPSGFTASRPQLPLFYTASDRVRDAYSDLLQSLPWDYFVTITFRRQRRDTIFTPRQVWNVFKDHHSDRAFFAVEPHRLGGLHLHALVHDKPTWHPSIADPAEYLEAVFCNDAGFSTVTAPRDPNLASTYCAKYVTKGTNDYQLYGAPYRWSPEPDPPPSTGQTPLL